MNRRETISGLLRAYSLTIAATLAGSLFMLVASAASAQPWPRLPDGSVVLTVQGDRVVIPAPMLMHLNRASFYGIPTIPDSPSGTSLAAILADPDRFRPLLDNQVGGVNFSFNIGGLWGRDPADEANTEQIRQQPWLGLFGISTEVDRLDTSRQEWLARKCQRSHMGETWYEYRNFSHLLREGARIGDARRSFRICAGQFLISYSAPERWFPRERLPEFQDRFVAFFQAMLPDSPLEVFP